MSTRVPNVTDLLLLSLRECVLETDNLTAAHLLMASTGGFEK